MIDPSSEPRTTSALKIPALLDEVTLDLAAFVSPMVTTTPDYVGSPLAAEQLPVLFWLVENLQPRIVVDVGATDATAYFGICQALGALSIDARCFLGDPAREDDTNAGPPSIDVWRRHQILHHPRRSRIINGDKGDLLKELGDATVDLLVLHLAGIGPEQMEKWKKELLPRMSPGGVIVLDGLASGPHEVYEELDLTGPAFRFPHGTGFSVIAPGKTPPALVKYLGKQEGYPANASVVRSIFKQLGLGCRQPGDMRQFGQEKSGEPWAARLVGYEGRIEELNRQLDWHRDELESARAKTGKSSTPPQVEDDLIVGLQEADRRLRESRTEIGNLRRVHDEEVAILTRSWKEKTIVLREEFERDRAELYEKIDYLQTRIAGFDVEMDQVREEGKARKDMLLEETAKLSRVSEEWRSQASLRQTEIEELERDQAELQATIDGLRTRLGDLEIEIHDVRDEGEARRDALMDDMAELTRISEEWRSRASLRQTEADELLLKLRMQRRARHEASAKLRLRARQLAKELDLARMEAGRWEGAAASWEKQVHELLSSTSWKVTRPLRAIRHFLIRRPTGES